MTEIDEVERHYHRPELLETILAGLEADDRDLEKLSPGDLEAVDQFHLMGREATVSLADLAAPGAGERVLDVGSGIGGAARYLAERFACSVVGVDLSPEFCRTANELSNLVGLAERTSFVEGSALELPVPAGSFDLAWTQHVQMNIADKATFYSQIHRALAPGGRLVFWDVFAGPGGEPHFPVPWASTPAISSLVSPDDASSLLSAAGFETLEWRDCTTEARRWIEETAAARQAAAGNHLGLHLVMGAPGAERLANMATSLREDRVRVVRASLRRG
jgi:ubiquinone/menaquinone biosynthesis C-methylase UbiE